MAASREMRGFHKISVKHMDRYLEELEWRHNNRDNPYIFVTRFAGSWTQTPSSTRRS